MFQVSTQHLQRLEDLHLLIFWESHIFLDQKRILYEARAAAVVRLTRSLLDPELFPHTAYVKTFALGLTVPSQWCGGRLFGALVGPLTKTGVTREQKVED